jgi:hypothetical protein
MTETDTNATVSVAPTRKRLRLSQEDVPGNPLEQALRVPRAIAESYGFKPTRPMHVASAMKMSPTSGPFRGITGASIAYGLTTGGAQGAEIAITPLGIRIVRPTTEGDDLAAKREALLRPKIIGEFLRQYDGSPLPADQIAKNVLASKGVPEERIDDVLALIVEGADAVGFLKEIAGKRWVDLTGVGDNATPAQDTPNSGQVLTGAAPAPAQRVAPVVSVAPAIHVNIEIHIAADASSQVIEEIFKNMRRYVLSSDGTSDE